MANITLFKTVLSASLPSLASIKVSSGVIKPIMILALLFLGGFVIAIDPVFVGLSPMQVDSNVSRVPISLTNQTAGSQVNSSDLFFVQNATGLEGNMSSSVRALIELMASQGLYFYNTTSTPDGLIGSDDVIIIKMNGQWDYRGGTNTDLIKSVITAVVAHPDRFTGEVVVADNGQGRGSMDWSHPNSYFQNQSTQTVAECFSSKWNVCSISWDNLRAITVDDYNDGDFTDGYVRSSLWNEETSLYVSYPKFQSPATGAYISFKQGVWSNDIGFDSGRLKVINMPVLKTHSHYGVTGCIKHYMGVPQGHIVGSVSLTIPHEHFSIAEGGMATLMVETRAPILNILDMVWVNAHPLESSGEVGPSTWYQSASATDIIGASTDPVALDYWSAKHVLMPTAEYLNYTTYTSLDPDNETIHVNMFNYHMVQEESFHNYLERSKNILEAAGFQATMDQSEMNVFVVAMSATGPVSPTTPTSAPPPDYVPLTVGVLVLGFIIAAVVAARRRSEQT